MKAPLWYRLSRYAEVGSVILCMTGTVTFVFASLMHNYLAAVIDAGVVLVNYFLIGVQEDIRARYEIEQLLIRMSHQVYWYKGGARK